MPNIQTKHLKVAILMVAIFFESLLISTELLTFAYSQNFFNPPPEQLGVIAILLLLLMYTYSLTIGAWNKWEQYVIVPAPIVVGISYTMIKSHLTYGSALLLLIYLVLVYDVHFATRLKDQLVKFNPQLVLRFSSRGILLVFAAVASFFVLTSPMQADQIDVAKDIAQIVQKRTDIYLDQTDQYGIKEGLSLFGINIAQTVETEVNKVIEPYKQFVVPVLALITFGYIQFVSFVVYFVFSATIRFVFMIAYATGFLKKEFIQVEQEVLRF